MTAELHDISTVIDRCGGIGIWCPPRILKIVGSNPAGAKSKKNLKIKTKNIVWVSGGCESVTTIARQPTLQKLGTRWLCYLPSGTSCENRAGSWGSLGRGVACHTLVLPLGGATSWT